MTFGTTLRLPGEYFNNEDISTEPQIFVDKLRRHMQDVKSQPTAHHCRRTPFTHKTLYTSTHVFIRVDSTKKPLDQPYEGLFQVLDRPSDSFFKILFKGHPTNISVDRLKPAFLENIPEDSQDLTGTTDKRLDTLKPALKTYSGPRSNQSVTFAH